MPHINLGIGIWLLPLIGFVLAILILWQGRKSAPTRRKSTENREQLIRAIGTLSQKAIQLVEKQERQDKFHAEHPNLIDTEINAEVDETMKGYRKAISQFENEKLVAGDTLKDSLEKLQVFISCQVMLKLTKHIVVGIQGNLCL